MSEGRERFAWLVEPLQSPVDETLASALAECRHGRVIDVIYDYMLRCAGGSVEALERLVGEAVADPVAFDEYVRRWRAWMTTAAQYESEPRWMAFMAPVLRSAAPTVARHRFVHFTSHMVLCLFDEGRSELSLANLYVVPVLGGSVFISERDEVRMVGKGSEALRAVGGELLAEGDAPARIAFHVSRLFPLGGP